MGVKFQSNVSWGGSSHGSGNGGNGGSDVSGLDFLNDSPPDSGGNGGSDVSGLDWLNPSSGVETVDYTSDPVQEDLISDDYGDVSGLDFLNPSSGVETTEADKWDWFNELQDTWEGSGSNPLYTYNENYPPLGISSPYAMQGMEFDPYSGQWYATQGDISPAWQGATKGEPGAVLIDGEWKKPILSGLGSHFMENDELWSGGAPDLSDPAVMENIKDIQQDYYANVHPSSQPDTDEPVSWGGGGGGGSGGGGGYYGDPRTGNPIDRYGNFYTPQANLQQAMVNVHGTPTVFKKHGGIVSLLRL